MDKLKTIVKVLDEKLAEDIVVIDMSIDSPICDYFVIASASNERLLLALKDHIEDACDKERYYVKNIEGRKNCKWILMDYGDIVVHLFDPEERKNYGIERDSGHFRPTRFVQIRRTIVARRHRRVVVGRQTHECRKQLQSERTDRNIHLHRGRGHPARRGFHQNLRTYAGTASHQPQGGSGKTQSIFRRSIARIRPRSDAA